MAIHAQGLGYFRCIRHLHRCHQCGPWPSTVEQRSCNLPCAE